MKKSLWEKWMTGMGMKIRKRRVLREILKDMSQITKRKILNSIPGSLIPIKYKRDSKLNSVMKEA
jgi:hypothetical protein